MDDAGEHFTFIVVIGVGLVVLLDTDKRRVERDAVNKRFGSVDRVEDPAKAAGPRFGGELFPQDRVVRELLGDAPAKQLLGAAVGFGYRGTVPFELNTQTGLVKMFKCEIARFFGDFDGEFKAFLHIHDLSLTSC